MKEYYRITTDVVMAEPMTREEFEDLIDWHPPLEEGESPDDKGYRIEDNLGTSWMTVEQFNKSHTVGVAFLDLGEEGGDTHATYEVVAEPEEISVDHTPTDCRGCKWFGSSDRMQPCPICKDFEYKEILSDKLVGMEFKGTKGKWDFTSISNFSDTLVSYIGDGKGKQIAQLRGCTTGEEEEALANARLIATAPTILEALQEIHSILDSQELNVNSEKYKLWEIANRALKEAIGAE